MLYSPLHPEGLEPGIVLAIVEALDYDPADINALKCTSKSLRALLTMFEKSIVRDFNKKKTRFPAVYALGWGVKQRVLKPDTYRWLEAVSARPFLSEQLLRTIKIYHCDVRDFPAFEGMVLCKGCAHLCVHTIWQMTFESLFTISDGWHGCRPKHHDNCRMIMEKSLDVSTLASLLCIMNISAVNWVNATCGGIMIEDGLELECVYRELLLKHGPYFLWASYAVADSKEQKWVRGLISEGWKELKSYETGQVINLVSEEAPTKVTEIGEPKLDTEAKEAWVVAEMPMPSLHSILLREFCQKAECTMQNFWDTVHDLVHDMINDHGDDGDCP